MAKELKIRMGEQEGILTLFDDKAPVACSMIIEHLPLKSHAIIAKVAGLEVMMRVPFFLDTYPLAYNHDTTYCRSEDASNDVLPRCRGIAVDMGYNLRFGEHCASVSDICWLFCLE